MCVDEDDASLGARWTPGTGTSVSSPLHVSDLGLFFAESSASSAGFGDSNPPPSSENDAEDEFCIEEEEKATGDGRIS